jgi:hypothetical protein
MSEGQKRRYENPDERRKINEGHAGKKHTEESRRNMSEALKGKPKSEDARGKMSEPWQGKSKSEEQRRKMSDAQRKRFGTDPDTPTSNCKIIKKHHEILKEDPERLSSDFIQKIIGIDCSKL